MSMVQKLTLPLTQQLAAMSTAIYIAIVGGPSKDPLVEWRRSEWVERSEYMKK